MSEARFDHTATFCPVEVLVAGGGDSQQFTTFFASASCTTRGPGSLPPTGSMTVGTFRTLGTLLADGTVLVAGGFASMKRSCSANSRLYAAQLGQGSDVGA